MISNRRVLPCPCCARALRVPAPSSSEADLAAAPVAAELVVADLCAGLHAEPLRQRPVLLDLLGEVHLPLEGLDRAHLGYFPLASGTREVERLNCEVGLRTKAGLPALET